MTLIRYLFLLLGITSLHADSRLVSSLGDSGPGTLREAIANAQDLDIIQFDASLSGTIFLQSSLPSFNNGNIVVAGLSETTLTIDGGGIYSIFDVPSGTVDISNLSLSRGARGGRGGTAYVHEDATLYLDQVALSAEEANALYVETGGNLYLTDVATVSSVPPDLAINTGSVEITNNIPVQYTFDILSDENITLYKQGNATAFLTVASPSPGLTLAITQGLVSFQATHTGPCIVFDEAALGGMFSASYIVNYGMLKPGEADTFGTIVSQEDYIQLPQGKTSMKIHPSGQSDSIQVMGNLILNNSTLEIIPQSGMYLPGTKYTLMTFSGEISGTFETVSAEGLDIQVHYLPGMIQIEILNFGNI